MKKIAYGVFSSKSRGLPIAIFNSKWHAEDYAEGRKHRLRKLFVKRIWLETADKQVYTVVDHLGFKSQVHEL